MCSYSLSEWLRLAGSLRDSVSFDEALQAQEQVERFRADNPVNRMYVDLGLGAGAWPLGRLDLSREALARVLAYRRLSIADRAEALLARRGDGPDEDPADAQQVIQSAAVAGRSAVRRGRRARRVQALGGRPHRLPPKCANCDGYGLHAGVVIGPKDRKGLERLCRYVARPPLAKPRLEAWPDGGVRVRFKRVVHCTDDKSLSKAERKLRTIEHAGRAPHNARLVKLADRIANCADIVENPPASWGAVRIGQYRDWSRQVVDALRGTHAGLEARFDAIVGQSPLVPWTPEDSGWDERRDRT